MKTLKLFCVINKNSPIIEFKNLIPLNEKHNLILDKEELLVMVEVKEYNIGMACGKKKKK